MYRLLLSLLLLVCSFPLLAVDWVGHVSSVGMVYAPRGEEQLVAVIVRMAEEEKARLVPLLGVRAPKWFPIYVYTDRVAFMRDAGPNLELLGESFQPTGLIRINAAGAGGALREVVAHEMVHSLLTERLGSNIGELPVWVNEGTATLYADHISADDLLSIAQLVPPPDGTLTIAQLESAFATGQSEDAAYQQSRSMVAWLEYRHPGALNELFDQLNDGHGFETALYRSAGLTPDAWLQQWRQGIPHYLVWLNITLGIISSPVIFAPLGILLAMAFIVKLLRKNREEDEEDEDDADVLPPSAPLSPSVTRYPIWDDIHSEDER